MYPNPLKSMAQSPPDWRVTTAVRLAQTCFRDHAVTLKSVAREVRTSPSYLGRLFRKTTSVRFRHYMLGLRMNLAAALLVENPERSIKEVASLVGYHDDSDFVCDFRGYYGTTPGKYSSKAATRSKALDRDAGRNGLAP
jgi:AraC-like DNA-binding protein